MDLKCISLNETTQSRKLTYCTISFIWHSREGKNIGTEENQWLPVVGDREGQKTKVTLWGNSLVVLKFFSILSVVMVTNIYTSKKLRIIQQKTWSLLYVKVKKTFLKSLLGLFVIYRGRKFSGFKHTIIFLNLHHLRIKSGYQAEANQEARSNRVACIKKQIHM